MTFRFLLSVIAIPACIGTIRAQEAKASVEEILHVWKSRQDKAPTARFEMSVEETIPKGAITRLIRSARGVPKSKIAEEPPSPPRDVETQGTSTLVLRGSEVRYSCRMPKWNKAKAGLFERNNINVFDGQVSKSLYDSGEANPDNYPTGYIQKSVRSKSGSQFAIIPLIWAFRGNHPSFFSDLHNFVLSKQLEMLKGRPCLALSRDTPKMDRKEVFYLDAERDYVVVRMVIIERGQPKWEVNARYTADRVVGWVPHSWEFIIRSGKEISETQRRTLTSHEFGGRVDDSEFDIEFPAGTRVIDDTSGTSVQYVMKDGNEKGRIVPSHRAPTYEELLGRERALSRPILIAIWGGAFLLILIAWVLVRWRRRLKTVSDAS